MSKKPTPVAPTLPAAPQLSPGAVTPQVTPPPMIRPDAVQTPAEAVASEPVADPMAGVNQKLSEVPETEHEMLQSRRREDSLGWQAFEDELRRKNNVAGSWFHWTELESNPGDLVRLFIRPRFSPTRSTSHNVIELQAVQSEDGKLLYHKILSGEQAQPLLALLSR